MAVSGVAADHQYTPVSGPKGPLTRRYATTAAKPCRDHSDGAHRPFIAFSGYGLAGLGEGIGDIYQNGTGYAGLPATLTIG